MGQLAVARGKSHADLNEQGSTAAPTSAMKPSATYTIASAAMSSSQATSCVRNQPLNRSRRDAGRAAVEREEWFGLLSADLVNRCVVRTKSPRPPEEHSGRGWEDSRPR